jgi:hypothetical protein
MITKMELVEGELGRFAMIRGEEPTQTYNRLKTLVKERHTCLMVASAFDKYSLFPNERHTCLMAKEKKVHIRDTPKYTSSSDEESSDDEVDYQIYLRG